MQESRIAIMMSQIQPHFLYNVLNTIYHLCGKDDNTAKTVISDFSDYLRNNLDSLERKGLVPFSTEYNHVKTYLDIEKTKMEFKNKIVLEINKYIQRKEIINNLTKYYGFPTKLVVDLYNNRLDEDKFKTLYNDKVDFKTKIKVKVKNMFSK